jgi:histidinol phosphatase-like enzyme
MGKNGRPVVFLDRDGVLNYNRSDYRAAVSWIQEDQSARGIGEWRLSSRRTKCRELQ